MTYKSKIFLLIVFLVVLIAGAVYAWGYYTGNYTIGADAITGCQNSKLITSFVGRPGKNLVTYNLFGHDVTVNEKITGSLDAVQRDVLAAKTGYNFDDIQTYNYRRKTGGGGLSLHSWGIAIDINPSRNPDQAGKTAEAQTDIPSVIINIFRQYGFQWGGDWVGARDPMHFEWYGSGVAGSTVDAESDQKITSDVAVLVDGLPVVWNNGNFNWTLPATHPHTLQVTTPGYQPLNTDFQTSCFQTQNMNIGMTPYSDNLAGKISGRVTISGGGLPLIPVNIYLDGNLVTQTDVNGDYTISNVRKGSHTISASILFSNSVSVSVPQILPQQNITGVNIEMGAQ